MSVEEGKSVYLCATLDTKAEEALLLKAELEKLGHKVTLADFSLGGTAADGAEFLPKGAAANGAEHSLKGADADGIEVPPKDAAADGAYISRAEIMGPCAEALANAHSRSEAMKLMCGRLGELAAQWYREGKMEGIISLGGSGGCTLASAAMRGLPYGFPKVILSTMASGNTLPYLQGEDILLINPVADIQNLNFVTRHAIRQAAATLHALIGVGPAEHTGARTIAVSGFGVTTPCVDECSRILREHGYEVLIFHARGSSGGRIMEKMIRQGKFCAVLDITTSELADEVAGGIYAVGPQRLCGAIECGLPYVVVPGALEMVNLGSEETLLPWQRERVLYRHSPSSVKMRTDRREMEELGRLFADRLKPAANFCSVMIPTKGFSSVNTEGQVFYDPAADRAFTDTLLREADRGLTVECLDMHVNDRAFARRITERLLSYLRVAPEKRPGSGSQNNESKAGNGERRGR